MAEAFDEEEREDLLERGFNNEQIEYLESLEIEGMYFDICKLMDKAIENHFAICIWPEMMQEKDINDMILSGFTSDEIVDIIDKNTFVNLRAKMEYIQWKKI